VLSAAETGGGTVCSSSSIHIHKETRMKASPTQQCSQQLALAPLLLVDKQGMLSKHLLLPQMLLLQTAVAFDGFLNSMFLHLKTVRTWPRSVVEAVYLIAVLLLPVPPQRR
jgi:hypothetical protein